MIRLGVLALLLASCGGGDPLPPPPSAAEMLRHRPYQLLSPPPGGPPAPLIIALHGQGGNGEEIGKDLFLTPLQAQRGFFLALPDGSNDYGRRSWNATTLGLPPYDHLYLPALIDDVLAHNEVDPKRVYVVGYSIGAFMAHRLACVDSAQVAAIVSIAGAVTTAPADCKPAQPVSMVELHGDLDTVITYDGGPFIGDPPHQSGSSAHDTASVWARNDACTGALGTRAQLDLAPDLPGAETRVDSYAGCPPGVSVELWTVHGGGHNYNTYESFGATLYDWLQAHPKP